ncbi:MAG TPA: CGNR zinc finger domain-containing protein [Brevibacterium sp.]|nr:CGNR zinc finger domain-containing protein [Brevibacterium sp.]
MALSVHTQSILRLIAALANSALDGETIRSRTDVREFALAHDFSDPVRVTGDDVPGLHSLRTRLRATFAEAPETPAGTPGEACRGASAPAPDRTSRAAALANALFQETHALPQLQEHDGWGWHLHAVPNEAGIAIRTAADIAIALADAVVDGEASRIGPCSAVDCDALFVDLSRNRSKRFCDRGNCANRTHVAAYRARRTP